MATNKTVTGNAKKSAAKTVTGNAKKSAAKKSMATTSSSKGAVRKAVAQKTVAATRTAAAKNAAAAKKSTSAGETTVVAATGGGAAGVARDGLRVRMYRVGFGDFFLLTIPTTAGPQHILIDCGVHAGNIKTMPDCVADLVAITGRKLALVIVTHFHADHLSGFATQYDEFAQFDVGAVWVTNRLDPADPQSSKLKMKISSLALHLQLQLRLSARTDIDAVQAAAKVENALGVSAGGNDKAMELVTSGFRNRPPVYYYQAGDTPKLPASLLGEITAQILGPAPKTTDGDFSASDNKAEQYLAAVAEEDYPDTERIEPFERGWPANASDYADAAFDPWTPSRLESVLHAVQPDVLAAAADAIDGTLNNQSLVVLFTCKGKKLLFVGDAQWGNWAYWLYGHGVKGADPGISADAKKILGSIDFYKVGHHGSTNATPIPAVSAMPSKCVAMCSTETGFPSDTRTYGSIKKGTEVPRIPLMKALEQQTKNKLVRSDWLEVKTDDVEAPASPEAHDQLEKLPPNFEEGNIYIEYVFPD